MRVRDSHLYCNADEKADTIGRFAEKGLGGRSEVRISVSRYFRDEGIGYFLVTSFAPAKEVLYCFVAVAGG